MLLAFADDEERNEMLASIPGYHRQPSKTSVKKNVARIRSDGYECIPSPLIQGVQDIGYPVFERLDRIAAVLVVPFLAYLDGSHPVKLGAAQQAIEEAAGAMSRQLGA